MIYKNLFLSIILLVSFQTNAQNLIPNGDFEEYSECPIVSNQLYKVDEWFSPTLGTPEFLHECAPGVSVVSIPYNFFGYQPAQSGKGFVALILYHNSGLLAREYISTALTIPLEKAACYKFEMYTNLSNGSQSAIDRIGVYFSDTIINNPPENPLPYTPQIENKEGNIITDTMNWTPIRDTFQAQGNEQYIVIGNFRSDDETQSLLVNPNVLYGHGYYYIDNVSLEEIDCSEYIIPNQDIIIYPNPVSNQLNIKIENQAFTSNLQLRLFNSIGQFIAVKNIEGKDIYSWDISYLPEGIYFLEITFLGKKYIRKVVKI